jgi:hypothetical protein
MISHEFTQYLMQADLSKSRAELAEGFGLRDHTLRDYLKDELAPFRVLRNVERERRIREALTKDHKIPREELASQIGLSVHGLTDFLAQHFETDLVSLRRAYR